MGSRRPSARAAGRCRRPCGASGPGVLAGVRRVHGFQRRLLVDLLRGWRPAAYSSCRARLTGPLLNITTNASWPSAAPPAAPASPPPGRVEPRPSESSPSPGAGAPPSPSRPGVQLGSPHPRRPAQARGGCGLPARGPSPADKSAWRRRVKAAGAGCRLGFCCPRQRPDHRLITRVQPYGYDSPRECRWRCPG